MCIGINTNRGALSLVKSNGTFQNKFSTIEEARTAAKGNSTNQTLKKGNEAIVKNDDGTYSLHYLTNETDPVKKAAAEKALIDMARKGDTSQFNPKIVEFSLASAYDGNIKIVKPTAQPATTVKPVEEVKAPTTPTTPIQNIKEDPTYVAGSDTAVTDNMIKLPEVPSLSLNKPFSLSPYNPKLSESSFGLKLDSSFDNSFDFDFMSNYGFDLSNTYGGLFNDFNFLDFGTTTSPISLELQSQANSIVTNPDSNIKNLLPPETAIKDLNNLPKGLKTLISNEYSDDLSKVNKDLSSAVERFNKGEKLSDLDLVLLSKSLKDTSLTVSSSQSVKELTDLSILSDKISEKYITSSVKLVNNTIDVSQIASDEASFEIGNDVLNNIIKDTSLEQDLKVKKVQDIRNVLADPNMTNKAKVDKLIAKPFDIKSLNNIDPKLLENDKNFFSNQIMQIDRVIKGFDTGTDEAALMANAMSFAINDDNVTVEKIREISEQKIDIIRKNQAETSKTLQTNTNELSNYINGNSAVKDSLIGLENSDIDLKTVDQDILASLRRTAIADIKNKNITVEAGKLSETVDAMIQSQIKESIAKLKTPKPSLSTGDTLRLAMLSNQLPSENKAEIDTLKSKGQDLAKRLDYINKNNIIIANKETMVNKNLSDIDEDKIGLSAESLLNGIFGNVTDEAKTKSQSITPSNISKDIENINIPETLAKVETMIKNYNQIINNPSTSKELKNASIEARDAWLKVKNEATGGSKDKVKIDGLVVDAMSKNEKAASLSNLSSSEQAQFQNILKLNQEISEIRNIIINTEQSIVNQIVSYDFIIKNTSPDSLIHQQAEKSKKAWEDVLVNMSAKPSNPDTIKESMTVARLRDEQYAVINSLMVQETSVTEEQREQAATSWHQLENNILNPQSRPIIKPTDLSSSNDGSMGFSIQSNETSTGDTATEISQNNLIVGDELNDFPSTEKLNLDRRRFKEDPNLAQRSNSIVESSKILNTYIQENQVWDKPTELAQKQKEIAVAFEQASPNVKCLLAMLAASSMPELQSSIPALGVASTDTTAVGEEDLSVETQIREITEDNIRRSEEAEANLDDTIDASSANVSNLLRAFREIISKLDIDLSAVKNSVSGRTQIDRKFSESLKENRARWNQLDEAKKEYQQHFQSSAEVQKPTLPPSLQKAFEKLDATRIESNKISVKLEVLTNHYNKMIESGQKPDARLIADLNNQLSLYSAIEKKSDRLFADIERLMDTTVRD